MALIKTYKRAFQFNFKPALTSEKKGAFKIFTF